MNIPSYDMLEGSMRDIPANSLVRLIYVSGLNTTSSSVFKHIQSHSASFNKANNIAGFLCNNTRNFLQCLEGSKDTVSALMQRIFKDQNHKDVEVVFIERVSGYSFTDWRMHSLNLDGSNWDKLSEHTQLSDISPFKPEKWPSWFVEHFIESVKRINHSDINQKYITFDTLGYSAIDKKLVSNSILFYIFLSVLICSAVVTLLFKYDVIP